MATTAITIAAPVDAVFDTLMDPSTYQYWVVGTKRVRRADDSWPSPGSAFHHTVGFGPLATRDQTRVLELQRPQRLVLEASIWPAGTNLVAFMLQERGDVTDLRLEEEPLRGPARVLPRALSDAVLSWRNRLGLRRFRQLVELRNRSGYGRSG